MGNETPLVHPNGLYPTLCGIALVCALDSDTHTAHSGGPVFFGMADPSHDASFHSMLCGSQCRRDLYCHALYNNGLYSYGP